MQLLEKSESKKTKTTLNVGLEPQPFHLKARCMPQRYRSSNEKRNGLYTEYLSHRISGQRARGESREKFLTEILTLAGIID